MEKTKNYPVVHLRPGREKSLLRKHPWVFSGAIASVEGSLQPGETVLVLSSDGQPMGVGAYSPKSQIRIRMWSFKDNELIDEPFFKNRLSRAIALREHLGLGHVTNAYRLVHGESDLLPGVIADRYGDIVVLQLLSAGAEYWRDVISSLISELAGVDVIYERSDADVRELEDLPLRKGLLWGEFEEKNVVITEYGLDYWADIAGGQKTGFFLDQRDNRRLVRLLAEGKNILDCFAYTGGFTVSALAGQANSVVAVEISEEATVKIAENLQLNPLPLERVEIINDDVFRLLRRFRDMDRQFDMVILDPPKFAPTKAHASRAARGYKDINLLALKLLKPGGLLVTFSCSGGITPEFFQQIVFSAAKDANIDAQVLYRLYQPADHPVALSFPEGLYLKGLVLRKI